jgi:hypothetical protein
MTYIEAADNADLFVPHEDAPLFASEANPVCGPSIRQGAGPMFTLWSKWLGNQWSIGNWDGMRHAMPRELPASMLRALAAMAPAGTNQPPDGPPQDLRDTTPNGDTPSPPDARPRPATTKVSCPS